jgi:hypothetical protein
MWGSLIHKFLALLTIFFNFSPRPDEERLTIFQRLASEGRCMVSQPWLPVNTPLNNIKN